jgi:hypothetical protein
MTRPLRWTALTINNDEEDSMMTKVMLSVIVGVFFGAFALEVLERKKPGLMQVVGSRVKVAADDFSRAFMEGYHGELPRHESV